MDHIPTDARHAGGLPRPRPQPQPRQRLSSGVLYRHAGILVTYDTLRVADRRYPVAELRNLRTSRGATDPATWWVLVLCGAVLAALGVAVSLTEQPAVPGRLTYAVLVCAVLGPVAVGVHLRNRARRTHELWGDYQGGTHLLFASADEREFGQVARALLRAGEAAGR